MGNAVNNTWPRAGYNVVTNEDPNNQLELGSE